jgi:NifU-like protein
MIPTEITSYIPSSSFSKKLREKIDRPRFTGTFSPEEAKEKGMRLVKAQEKGITFSWLVDESDGVIADAKFQAFGSIALLGVGEIASELVIRKTKNQASRISADLIDQHVRDKKEVPAFPKEAHAILNQAISAIDTAVQLCSDIICSTADYDVTPIEWDAGDNPNGIPGWDEFSHEKKIYLIEEVIDKEIRPYVELDAGGVKVIDLKENQELLISYQGSCTTCHSATGSTLTAIQQILRTRINPKISVIPQF